MKTSIMRRVRNLIGVSQERLAGIAGVSQATVSRWENGEFEPNRDELERIRAYAIANSKIQWDDAVFFDASRGRDAA